VADLAELRTNRTKILTTLDERTAALQQVQQALGTAQARVLELSRRTGDGGADRGDQRTELRSLSDRLEIHRAEKTALEGALAAARDERARLERALAQQRREADVGNERVLAENAELRRRIDEVADQILRVSDGEDAMAEETLRGKRRSRRPAATA
jgi:chromosome segregation ATPase